MLKVLKLKRFYCENETIGILKIDENLLFTLELPYKNNEKNISCINEGKYKLTKYNSEKFKNCFKINNVKDRSDILIHSGNTTNNTKGYVLVGCGINVNNNSLILSESKKALSILNKTLLSYQEIELIICG